MKVLVTRCKTIRFLNDASDSSTKHHGARMLMKRGLKNTSVTTQCTGIKIDIKSLAALLIISKTDFFFLPREKTKVKNHAFQFYCYSVIVSGLYSLKHHLRLSFFKF